MGLLALASVMPVGFIGGSGIYEALELEDVHERDVTTPYGDPGGPVTVGRLAGTEREVAFLPRHGPGHRYAPREVPYRANVHALKQLGVERVLSSNAVGSLREDLPPRTLVIPDQTLDRTRERPHTFFGDGIVVHVGVADPYCPHLVEHLADSARTADGDVERGGTYVCIEGPQFSTRAESAFYRDQGFDVVGMTAVPEAKLAREAELCYATVAGVTDYDVWKAGTEVTAEEVRENAAANREAIRATVERAVRAMPERDCDCGSALAGAIQTRPEAIPEDARERVDLLAGTYLE
jgi:5'-methylthioadenosine phosphorylase